MVVYLISYHDCLKGFCGSLSPPYSGHTGLKKCLMQSLAGAYVITHIHSIFVRRLMTFTGSGDSSAVRALIEANERSRV